MLPGEENLIILSEPNRRDVMGPVLADFGVQMVPGILVKPTKDFAPELIQSFTNSGRL